MTFMLAALALAAPLALPAPALSATAAPVPASDADRLVMILVPDQSLLDVIAVAVRKDIQRLPEFASDSAMADYVLGRLRPELDKVMRESLPALRAEMARIISGEMTAAEIAEVYAFFSSPTGQKLQTYAFQAIAENPALDQAEQQRIAVERFMANLAPADYPALTAFGASAGARKMPQVTPKLSAASAAWAQRLIAAHGPRFATLRAQAIGDYKRQKGGAQ